MVGLYEEYFWLISKSQGRRVALWGGDETKQIKGVEKQQKIVMDKTMGILLLKTSWDIINT